ncbi:MAG: hypothetical protein LBV13_01765 [Methanomassiliicoccaceae archaeon]|jgi:hypothetical protein|nr:hypothetical protein [Methanomassiliicoccaceae archaeon]
MDGHKKGGVLTKKMIALTAVVLLTMTAMVMILPTASAAEDDGMYADIRAESYVAGIGRTAIYTIYADGSDADVTYTTKIIDSGGSSAGSVSPGSGTIDMDEGSRDLTITAPGTAGSYELVVEFKFTNTSGEEVKITKTAPVIVIAPIKLTAVINNNAGAIVGMEIWFEVDGVKVENGWFDIDGKDDPNITIESGGSKTVTYNWLVEGISGGVHTFVIKGYVGPQSLDATIMTEPAEFFIGQTSYTLIEAIVVILFIVLVIVALWVFRKPVKNLGKPKGRR